MNTIWILVATHEKANIYERHGKISKLVFQQEVVNPHGKAFEREFGTDRPGRTFQSGTSNHSVYEKEHSLKDTELQAYVRELAEVLEKAMEEHKFEKLFISAGPSLLGKIRKELSPRLQSCLLDSIAKDLGRFSPQELEEYLAEQI